MVITGRVNFIAFYIRQSVQLTSGLLGNGAEFIFLHVWQQEEWIPFG